MSLSPEYEMPEEPSRPKRKPNTVLWVILILVIGGGCALLILLAAVLFPVFSQARLAAQRSNCMSNMRQIARAHLIYADSNDGLFALRDNWYDSVAPYSNRVRRGRCPIAAKEKGGDAVGYGFNEAFSGKPMPSRAMRDNAILLFESADVSPGFSGNKKDLQTPGRHGSGANRGSNFAYCDGTAKFVRDADDPGLWNP